jgi:hypothetical protein
MSKPDSLVVRRQVVPIAGMGFGVPKVFKRVAQMASKKHCPHVR